MFEKCIDYQTLGSLFQLNRKPIVPALAAEAEFFHHSLPAWDNTRKPILELGGTIESNKILVDKSAILVSKLNPRKPRVSVVEPGYGERHCASTEFMCFVPIDPSDNLHYWSYYFGAESFSRRLQQIAIGSTNSHTRADPNEVLKWVVPNPSKAQKDGIVSVLDTVDTSIRQTEAIIEKLKQVKHGLLHDLLTRGIDANGVLRPPRSQAPHLYNDSPLGWIPSTWNEVRLQDVLVGIDGGWSPECIEETPNEGQWGVLKISAISSGTYLCCESKTLPSHLQPDPSIEVLAGDVLLARANGVAELVAVTVYVPFTPARLMLSDKTLRLRPNTGKISGQFLATLMSFQRTRKQIRCMLNGSSGQQNISQRQIGNLLVALPSLSEQLLTNQRLTEAEDRIAQETNALEKLQRMKLGLMDDLLTGRVRVTPLLDTVDYLNPSTARITHS